MTGTSKMPTTSRKAATQRRPRPPLTNRPPTCSAGGVGPNWLVGVAARDAEGFAPVLERLA